MFLEVGISQPVLEVAGGGVYRSHCTVGLLTSWPVLKSLWTELLLQIMGT